MQDTDFMSTEISDGYRRFAAVEARGASPLYESLALHVAESDVAQDFLSALSRDKRQPNLFFAAIRHVAGTPESSSQLEDLILDRGSEIAEVMCRRTTQTNEPGRCAVLLPVLSTIDGPVALIEVGASAGLCLLPDKYGYRYGNRVLAAPEDTRSVSPTLVCSASENTPIPTRFPSVVWRAGIDLNPLDVDRDNDVAWLETLVWPEQETRLAQLRAAVTVARQNKPRVVCGDLRRDLPDMVLEAPADATLVIFHSAVLTYLPSQDERDEFARLVQGTGATWLSNEAPKVFPRFARRADSPDKDGMFLLARNARPIAWTAPHGQAINWL